MAEETIRRLYDALDRRDGDAAAACYAGDAVFEDPAFGRLEDGAVKDMRRWGGQLEQHRSWARAPG